MNAGFLLIEKNICEKIIFELDKIGLLYRIFSRSKDEKSISEKIERKAKEGSPYVIGGKLIQDVIGIRVVTYFKDDIDLVKEILRREISFLGEEIDPIELTVFKPKRTNIICSFNAKQKNIFNEVQASSVNCNYKYLDSTYELQLRTMLSEGWHEIDHSLRYKCKSDWVGFSENERMLNGIYASLETNDIVLKNLFNELAYKHFKNNNWEGLIRNKFRLKFQLPQLRNDLKEIMNADPSIGKNIIKLDRHDVLTAIHNLDISPPVNLNNILYLINVTHLKNKNIFNVTPSVIYELADFQIDKKTKA